MDGLILGDEALSFLCRPHSKRSLTLPSKVQSKNIGIGFTNRPFFGPAEGLGEPPLASFPFERGVHIYTQRMLL
jgi:hypothetical protein